MGMWNCPDCKDKNKMYNEISSRHDSMMYHIQDYDRTHGKGAFKKKFPESHKMMEDLMAAKTMMLTDHMSHDMPVDQQDHESMPMHSHTAGVPVIK